jgi:uroporphyrin-III C-methyltransferase
MSNERKEDPTADAAAGNPIEANGASPAPESDRGAGTGVTPEPGRAHSRGATRAVVASVLALMFALLAGGFAGWQWRETSRQMEALQQQLARRLSEADEAIRQAHGAALQNQEAIREAQAKLSGVQSKLVESQNQQVALEALYQELSRNRDEWSLAEVEQIIDIAYQRLQLEGNVKAALIALEVADGRLEKINRPQLAALHKIVLQDIERLKAVPFVDTPGISARLENVIATVDTLPLVAETRPTGEPHTPEALGGRGFWAQLGRDAWRELKQLVRVDRIDGQEAPLLSPQQSFFLRENLKLRLLSARLALLNHNETTYKADLAAGRAMLGRFFDVKAQAAQNALSTLHQLADTPIDVKVPDISASLEAVRNFRLTRQNGPR